jgi:GNAT superfamily N-acetyltransferase
MDIVRAHADSEFSALHTLLIEYERSLPIDLRHGAEPTLNDVTRTYVGQNAAFLARFVGEYGGCVVVEIVDVKTAVLKRLYVQPARRGQGAARALAATAISFARDSGSDRVVLDTEAERLSPAAALYRSMGFTECAPYGPVDYQNPTFMELRLR